MPIKASAIKYVRVTERKSDKNKKIKGSFRSAIKNLMQAIKNKNSDNMDKWFRRTQKELDKAVQKKVIKKNTCSRRKSRLNSLVKKTKQLSE